MALKPNTVKQVRELWNEFDALFWVLIKEEVENGGLGADENDPRSQKRTSEDLPNQQSFTSRVLGKEY